LTPEKRGGWSDDGKDQDMVTKGPGKGEGRIKFVGGNSGAMDEEGKWGVLGRSLTKTI